MECAAIIPCLNEAPSIASVVRGVRKHLETVWVLDDGSSDDTSIRARQAGAQVLRTPVNHGKGWAVRQGLKAAWESGWKWALLLDGDGQHDPESIPAFLEAAQRNADLIIGNRMDQAHLMTPVRRWVNRWMSSRLSARLGRRIPDSQCGFRMVRIAAWSRVELRRNRYEMESEMLTAFVKARFNVKFVAIPCIPANRPSRINPASDTARWFRWWLAWRTT